MSSTTTGDDTVASARWLVFLRVRSVCKLVYAKKNMRYHTRLISADLKKKIAVQWEVSVILLRSLTGVLRFFFSEPFLYRSRTVDFPSNLFPSPGGVQFAVPPSASSIILAAVVWSRSWTYVFSNSELLLFSNRTDFLINITHFLHMF